MVLQNFYVELEDRCPHSFQLGDEKKGGFFFFFIYIYGQWEGRKKGIQKWVLPSYLPTYLNLKAKAINPIPLPFSINSLVKQRLMGGLLVIDPMESLQTQAHLLTLPSLSVYFVICNGLTFKLTIRIFVRRCEKCIFF